jgi:flagellar biogenesis protein FliO
MIVATKPVLFLVCLLGAPAQPSAPAPKPEISKETRPELFADEPPPRPGAATLPAEDKEPGSSIWFWIKNLLQTLLSLGIVVLLAYLLLNKALPRLMKVTGVRPGTHLVLIERLALDQKHSLFLVEVDGRRLVVGTGEQSTQLVADLDAATGQKSEIIPVDAMTKS